MRAIAETGFAGHVSPVAYTAVGRDAAALASIRRGLELHPQHVNALKRCAALLKKLGRTGEAVPFYERAIAEGPTAGMHFEFGEVLFGLRQRDRAIDQYRRAIELAAEDRGAVCQPARNATSPTAWQPAPLAEAHFSLGNALKDQGKMEEAAAHYRRAVERKPDSPMMHGNLLFCEQYRADVTPAGLAAAHAEWDRRYAAPLRAAWRPFSNDRSPHRPLRLGFVSCNFRQHPVGLFTIRVIEALKGHACDVVCYSDVRAVEDRFSICLRYPSYGLPTRPKFDRLQIYPTFDGLPTRPTFDGLQIHPT